MGNKQATDGFIIAMVVDIDNVVDELACVLTYGWERATTED